MYHLDLPAFRLCRRIDSWAFLDPSRGPDGHMFKWYRCADCIESISQNHFSRLFLVNDHRGMATIHVKWAILLLEMLANPLPYSLPRHD